MVMPVGTAAVVPDGTVVVSVFVGVVVSLLVVVSLGEVDVVSLLVVISLGEVAVVAVLVVVSLGEVAVGSLLVVVSLGRVEVVSVVAGGVVSAVAGTVVSLLPDDAAPAVAPSVPAVKATGALRAVGISDCSTLVRALASLAVMPACVTVWLINWASFALPL